MRENLAGTLWRLSVYIAACLLGIFAIFAIFGQFRFDDTKTYNAAFTDVSGLKDGDFVRIAGVEVGKVKRITVQDDSTVNVEFTANSSAPLTQGNRAVIRYENLVGDRYLALDEGAGSIEPLKPGQTIPLARTQPALNLNALIGGFRPLFRALEPDQVNMLTGQLIQAFQGQGAVIGSFLNQTGTLTSTLADRDRLIGEVIDNLDTVLASLADHSQQFDEAITSLSELVKGLAARKTDISNGVAYIEEATSSITDLLAEARTPFRNTVQQTDRTAGLVVADHEYVDNILATLPDKYRLLNRQGIYGDFFSFYLCDAVLKVNGKGGNPVYIKVAGQITGRCAPK